MRARIETLDGLSAHADREEIMTWLGAAGDLPDRIHLVHGEPRACEALGERIRERTGREAHIPTYREKVTL